MEWQQKAGRALKAWGRRSHWCCFRQKLFHVYACVTQPGDILCGDLSYNSSRGILFPKNAARVCSHLACVNVEMPLARAAARRPARALRISSRCVGWNSGFFGGCRKTHTRRTHQNHVSERYQDGAPPFQYPAYKSQQRETVKLCQEEGRGS